MKNSDLSPWYFPRCWRSLTAGLVGLFVAFSPFLVLGDALDYTVPPNPHDNFTEASFRIVNPDAKTPPAYVLVFIPGTNSDGRGSVTDPRFLAIATACHAALLCCDFKGIELGYDKPDGGTARALDDAISHFAQQMGQPKLAAAPLLLIGHSQGGNFTYNYICWRPERVKAFAATKWMIPSVPKPASFQVPGIVATGEKDETGRIQSIAKTYSGATGEHSKWAFLYQKDAGHELGDNLLNFIQIYFAGVCNPAPAEAPVLLNAETGNPETADSVAAGVCWFPDQQAADAWKALHKPTPLQTLMSVANPPY